MVSLDHADQWLAAMEDERALDVLTEDERGRWDALTASERRAMLEELLGGPADFTTVLHPWYFRNKWAEALRAAGLRAPVRLLELASGSNDVIPRALSFAFPHPETSYVTVNSNQDLSGHFREGIKDLPIRIDIIENDAKRIEDYAQSGSFDGVVFEHAVNDIIFDMLARKNGLDTVHTPWFDIYPDMLRLTNREWENGTLEASVKDALLGIFVSCLAVLRKDGLIIINHFMYQYDLDRGVNRDFWENLLPAVRSWVNGEGIGREVFFEGFEPQWWMFIKNA